MADEIIGVTVRFPYKALESLGPYSENTFHFFNPDPIVDLETLVAAAVSNLTQFYFSDAPDFDQSVSDFLSHQLDGSALFSVRVVNSTPVGPRFDTGETAFTASTEPSYPSQIACCLTSKCLPYDGITRRQSLYNRVYLGPLTQNAGTDNEAGENRPSLDFRNTITAAADRMANSGTNDPLSEDAIWCVFSTKNKTAGKVVGGFVDNVFDTQRKRYDAVTVFSRFPFGS